MRIRAVLRGDPPTSLAQHLVLKGETTIQARGADLRVKIDGQGRSWALVTDLLERYEIPQVWDASRRRILIGALDVNPPTGMTPFRLQSAGPWWNSPCRGAVRR